MSLRPTRNGRRGLLGGPVDRTDAAPETITAVARGLEGRQARRTDPVDPGAGRARGGHGVIPTGRRGRPSADLP
jgi:hypothetical protein